MLTAMCALFPQQDRAGEFQKMALKNMGRQALGNQTKKSLRMSSKKTLMKVVFHGKIFR